MNNKVKSKSNVIGILGGTFNPVHHGHIILAYDMMEVLELEKVYFIPCNLPPHKSQYNLADPLHRLEMLRLATQEEFRFEVLDVEIERGGISYTIDTIRILKKKFPDKEFVLGIGADTVKELPGWFEIEKLVEMCRFAVFERPDYDLEMALLETKKKLPYLNYTVISGHKIGISSTDIRYRVAEGLPVNHLVPALVAMYILEHNLYR